MASDGRPQPPREGYMLNYERVHLLRTSGKSDRYYANLWRMTDGAIRDARTGRTWVDHPTPPDTKPREQGRKRLRPKTDISAALSAWRSDNGSLTLPENT